MLHKSWLPFFVLLATSCQVTMVPKIISGKKPLNTFERSHLEVSSLAAAIEEAATEWGRRTPNVERYNKAVERFLTHLQARTPVSDWSQPIAVQGPRSASKIIFEPATSTPKSSPDEWIPSSFHKIVLASAVSPDGYDHLIKNQGWGVPIILINQGHGTIVKERYFRPNMPFFMPGTAVMEFLPHGIVKLRIINTFQKSDVVLKGRKQTVATDITALIEMKLDNPFIKKAAFKGLFNPEQQLGEDGLFSVAPYDPRKRPVVFVHGLRSSPRIWKNAVNEFYANRKLSQSYQPVLYFYPTGLGVPASAADLRKRLNQYRDKWDPDHKNDPMNHMILVGHSMGGLVAQMQVIDSGDELQKAFFRHAIDDTRGISSSQRKKAKDALIFEHQPFISRAIFIAVPHQGAAMADGSISHALRSLIKIPSTMMGMANLALLEDRGLLNPKLANYKLLGMRSVETLSPKHPYFAVLKKQPILVPWHSIIGDRSRGDSPNSSDGYVPYGSAHFPVAVSECVVPYPHSCAEKSETVREIVRILEVNR